MSDAEQLSLGGPVPLSGPPRGDYGPCSSCRRACRWTVSTKGKRLPLDPAPEPDGTIALADVEGETVGVVVSGDLLEHLRRRGAKLYRSHFATCPHADRRCRRS